MFIIDILYREMLKILPLVVLRGSSAFDCDSMQQLRRQQRSMSASAATATTTTVWILNHRSSSEIWAINVLHWYSITNRILNSFQIPYYYYNSNDNNHNNHDATTTTTMTI